MDLEGGVKRTIINGNSYSINLLPALPAYLLGTEIMETLIPAIGSAADNGMNFKDMFPEDRSPFTQVSIYLVKGLKDLDKANIINTLLEGAALDNAPLDIQTGMRGKVSDLSFLIEFALKENFNDFFIEYIKERVTGLIPLVEEILPEGLFQTESPQE
jgi:hypothetical protein